MTPHEIVAFIQMRRLPLFDEKRLQSDLADEFTAAGISFDREVRLGAKDRIDFLIGNVGLELKIKGQRRAIYNQCVRYCGHERVASLVLATNAAMGMPTTINGKLVVIAFLGRAWL